MRKGWLLAMLLGGAMAFPLLAVAADKGTGLPSDALFRYLDKNGNTVITSSLTDEALYAGYQILNHDGQVVETVPPGIPESERATIKAQREKAEQDKQLLRMYVSPDGALRTRNRQVETIQLKMSYAKNDLARQKAKLNEQISRAADYQKRGVPVPGDVQDLIDLYSGQVDTTEKTLAQYQADIAALNDKFDDIVKRLEALTGKKASLDSKDAADKGAS